MPSTSSKLGKTLSIGLGVAVTAAALGFMGIKYVERQEIRSKLYGRWNVAMSPIVSPQETPGDEPSRRLGNNVMSKIFASVIQGTSSRSFHFGEDGRFEYKFRVAWTAPASQTGTWRVAKIEKDSVAIVVWLDEGDQLTRFEIERPIGDRLNARFSNANSDKPNLKLFRDKSGQESQRESATTN